MNNYHILEASHIPQTNFRPPGIRLLTERFKQIIILPYDNEAGSNNPLLETAEKYLEGKGFEIIGAGMTKKGYAIITNTFKPLK